MSEYHDMPCGRCPCGIYALQAVIEGANMFRGVHTQREALRLAPRCKVEPSHICFGTRDFIISADWPMTDDKADALIAQVSA